MITGRGRPGFASGLFFRILVLATAACLAGSCQKPPAARVQAVGAAATTAPAVPVGQAIRVTGTVQAVRQLAVRVPTIEGQSSRLTLTRLVANGTRAAGE